MPLFAVSDREEREESIGREALVRGDLVTGIRSAPVARYAAGPVAAPSLSTAACG